MPNGWRGRVAPLVRDQVAVAVVVLPVLFFSLPVAVGFLAVMELLLVVRRWRHPER